MSSGKKQPPFNAFATAARAPKGFPKGCRLLLPAEDELPAVWTLAVSPGAQFELPVSRASVVNSIPCLITPLQFDPSAPGMISEGAMLVVIRRGRELADVATVMRSLALYGRIVTMLAPDMTFPAPAEEEDAREEGNGQ